MLVDDDDVNTYDVIHVMTKVTMQIEGEGTCLEMVRQCGFVCMCVYT